MKMPGPRQVPGRTAPRHQHLSPKVPPFMEYFAQLHRHFTCVLTVGDREMKSQTLQYYMHDGPSAFRFELAGDLNNEAARDLDQAWRTASSMIGDRALVVD